MVATLSAAIPPLAQQLRQKLDALAILLGHEPEALALAAVTLEELTQPPLVAGLPSELLAAAPMWPTPKRS